MLMGNKYFPRPIVKYAPIGPWNSEKENKKIYRIKKRDVSKIYAQGYKYSPRPNIQHHLVPEIMKKQKIGKYLKLRKKLEWVKNGPWNSKK